MTWVEFDKRRTGKPVAVIPTGAVEVYGPHLPLSSDSIVAEGVAKLVAAKLEGLCAPLVPVGYSADLMGFPGTLTVQPDAFIAYLDGICESLVHWGLDKFVFLNTHLGNVALIDIEADVLGRKFGVKALQIDWWRYSARVCRSIFSSGDLAVGHAGELGTSVLLFFAQDLCRMEAAVDHIPGPNPWPSGLTPYFDYREYTPTGVVGKPSEGSLEKGRQIVAQCVDSIVNDCNNFFSTPSQGDK